LPIRVPSSAYTWLARDAEGFCNSSMEGILPKTPQSARRIIKPKNPKAMKKTLQRIFTDFFINAGYTYNAKRSLKRIIEINSTNLKDVIHKWAKVFVSFYGLLRRLVFEITSL
jgi:hypothetical protein